MTALGRPIPPPTYQPYSECWHGYRIGAMAFDSGMALRYGEPENNYQRAYLSGYRDAEAGVVARKRPTLARNDRAAEAASWRHGQAP